MMARSQTPAPNMDQFEGYFQRADLDRDGRISGHEAVSFFQATNLPRPVLAKIWRIADPNETGFLARQEFYNALKLVTVAQSNRELTPEIVRAALYSEASARIPPPQLNLPRAPAPRPNITVGSSVPPANAVSAPQTVGLTTHQSQVMRLPTQINVPQIPGPQPNIAVGSSAPLANAVSAPQTIGLTSHQSQGMRPPRPPVPSAIFQSPQGVNAIRPSQYGGLMAGSQLPISSSWVGGNTVVPQSGVTSQPVRSMEPVGQDGLSIAPSGLPPSTQSGVQATSVLTQPALPKPSNNQAEVKDSKALAIVGNGHASDSLFGDVFSVTSVQAEHDSTNITSGVSSSPISSVVSMGARPTVKSSSLDPSVQITNAQHTLNSQHQQGQLSVKMNQATVQATSGLPTGTTGQSQVPWPRMTQSDILKYSKVFMQVDTDRDGKITGEQARNLFLSWRQPREVLKQVWDLSDQDKDSMLSLREFCIALYLMERYREGCPLPVELPSGIMSEETLSVSGHPAAPHENAAWRSTSGYQQSQTVKGLQAGASLGKPPRPVPIPQPEDSMQSSRQKPKVPVLEKHILDQLSSEEQNSLNSKFQEASDAEKKVSELEKEILDARERLQFYHAKMQELILYKSRCDNRLSEISERVSADRREVESLGKKYEEKYRQAGDVASKLTIEEATFRDIQDKKMELYRAIVKLEQDGDGVEERANRIQSDLEGLVKAVNERCKTYGLRAKPTSLVELPFGWQPGIQEGAADWDESWDSFEDKGFVIVKELTLDVQNVVAPPKPKSSLRNTESSRDEDKGGKSSSDADEKSEKVKRTSEDDGANTQSEEQTASSPPESPARSNALESEYKEVENSHSKKDIGFDGSPQANQSEHGAHESMFDRGFDEPGWGTFDSQYDADGFNHLKKDMESDRQSENSFFGSDDWGLNPIRTSTTQRDNMYTKQSPFFDSVPSTPNYSMVGSPLGDSLFPRKSPFAFADSLPSTPIYGSSNSPRRFSEGAEERSFENSFSRFDSFSAQDGGLFTPREPMSFSRFDSMRRTRDSEYDHGASGTHDSLARFDSFRSMANSDYNFGLFPPREQPTRFDSIRSTRDSDFGYRFSSFDDADPYGSNDPFKTTFDGQTPRKDSDSWNDHFKASFNSQTPRRESDNWNDHFKASFNSQTPRRESDSWNDHFKESFDSQTPRRDSNSWNDPFKKFESQTPRRDSGGWNAF